VETTPPKVVKPTTTPFEIKTLAKVSRVPAVHNHVYATKSDQHAGPHINKVHDDLLERINAPGNANVSEGAPFTIDVQPDFRFPLLAIFYYVSIYYKDLEQKNHALLSPATLTSYCLIILYGHFLISDYYFRSTKSEFAATFDNDSARRDFFRLILEMPVPAFMEKILRLYTPTSDPRRPKIEFTPSFAGFNHDHDFGRFFPVSIFMQAHHRAATTKANDDPQTLFSRFMNQPVSTGVASSVGNYFGAALQSETGISTYTSWLFTACQSMFNPAVQRALGQRFVFSPLYTPTPNLEDNYNPYIFLLNCDPENIDTTSMLVESIGHIVKGNIPCEGSLASRYSTLSGLAILMHSYTTYSLPTWHTSTTNFNPDVEVKMQSSTSRATDIAFLTQQSYAAKNAVTVPEDPNTVDRMLYLVNMFTGKGAPPHPPSTSWINFDVKKHVHPPIRVFDPYEYNLATLNNAVISGLIIETLELDGTSVPLPDLSTTLEEDNSQLLQSAIPLTCIIHASTTTPVVAMKRTTTEGTRQKVNHSLYDMTKNLLPQFAPFTGDTQPPALYGFSTSATYWYSRAFSHFGFTTRGPIDKNAKGPSIPDKSIVAWSPYRYVAPAHTPIRTDRIYMLVNFRTVYGTSVTLSELRHPSLSFPRN